MFHEQPSDADSKRTVTLSRRDLSAARRLLRLLLGVEQAPAEQLLRPKPKDSSEDSHHKSLLARAQGEFHNRRRRVSIFGQSMFGEAAWDMLLALYILDISGQRQTVGSLLHFSGTPMSTAKRWLDYLSAHDLVRREAHPTDRRTAFIGLTDRARQKLDMYFSDTIATTV
jgi:DNA-binding MarR family transcriptional regulator